MDTLAPLITAMTTAIAILSVIWIYRRTKRIDSVHCIFGSGIVLYTLYHFYACGILEVVDPIHGIITGLFISSVAWVNAYCSTCSTIDNVVNIGINRRKELQKIGDEDRRTIDSHTIFSNIVTLKRR